MKKITVLKLFKDGENTVLAHGTEADVLSELKKEARDLTSWIRDDAGKDELATLEEWLATVAKATSLKEISPLNYSWWALEVVTITADQDLLAGALQHTYWDAPSDSYDLVFWHRDFDIILRKVKAEQKPDEYYWDNPAHVAAAVAEVVLSDIEIKGR